MLFVFFNTLVGAGSWSFVIVRRRGCSSCFYTLPGAGSWTFVIVRWRICASCFLIRSQVPLSGLLWLTGGAYALRVLHYVPVRLFLDFCDEQAAHMLFMFLIHIPSPVPILWLTGGAYALRVLPQFMNSIKNIQQLGLCLFDCRQRMSVTRNKNKMYSVHLIHVQSQVLLTENFSYEIDSGRGSENSRTGNLIAR